MQSNISLQEYILLLPFANAVKYKDICVNDNFAASNFCLSQNGSNIKTFVPPSITFFTFLSMETISSKEKQTLYFYAGSLMEQVTLHEDKA